MSGFRKFVMQGNLVKPYEFAEERSGAHQDEATAADIALLTEFRSLLDRRAKHETVS